MLSGGAFNAHEYHVEIAMVIGRSSDQSLDDLTSIIEAIHSTHWTWMVMLIKVSEADDEFVTGTSLTSVLCS